MTRDETKKLLAQHDMFGCEDTLEQAMQDLDDHLAVIPEEYRADAYIGAFELYNTALKLIEKAQQGRDEEEGQIPCSTQNKRMIRNIIEIGNPALREVAKEVPIKDIKLETTQQLVDDLIETMRHANGAGLAATQIAIPLRVCVIEVSKNPRYPYKPDIPLTVLINPVITFLSEERLSVYEGCLSVPNVRGEVERCPEIRVQALDREGVEIDITVQGITAGTFQHELDHLDGVVFIDKVKDSKTLCTLKEFAEFHEDQFRNTVKQIVEHYGS